MTLYSRANAFGHIFAVEEDALGAAEVFQFQMTVVLQMLQKVLFRRVLGGEQGDRTIQCTGVHVDKSQL